MWAAAVSAKRGSVFSPVPTAVPPRASSCRPGSVPRTVVSAWSSWATQPEMTWPSVTGVASCRWVRPTMTTPSNSAALPASVSRSTSIAGISSSSSWTAAAMCITAGKVSLLDCPRLTSSLGWTGVPAPRPVPASSSARLAITSLAFMLLCVPLPVWNTTRGNSASSAPSMTSVGGARDELGLVLRQPAELLVGPRRRQLEHAERPDHAAAPAEPLRADGEVLQRALRLRAPVALRRDAHLAHAVVLDAPAPRPCR